MDHQQTIFAITAWMTGLSAFAAIAVALVGDTRRNEGHRLVVRALARIALIGASAIVSLLTACTETRCGQVDIAIHNANTTATSIRSTTPTHMRRGFPPPYSGDFS